MKEKEYVLSLSLERYSALCAYLSSGAASREEQRKFYKKYAQENPSEATRCQKMIDLFDTIGSITDELWNLK